MRKNFKKQMYCCLLAGVMMSTAACSNSSKNNENNVTQEAPNGGIEDLSSGQSTENSAEEEFDGSVITLADNNVLVDGKDASTDTNAAVYVGTDIVYYEEGHDDTYGAGSKSDEHSAEDAAKHTVVTISKPGTYKVTGSLAYGQIAIDLGEDAKKDENAVVTLVLDNANINCSVAPGIIVYKAYECGSKDTETATKDVDTKAAGFNLVIADNSTNVVNGAHVAKIYKEGTTDKLHKYDAAIESKVSFNINGGSLGNGTLTVNSDNEGIESGLHLTINGGILTINSIDDAINTNEDGVSVLTINDGIITCDAGGGKEGDGIDSNGWIIVNGGYIITSANASSADSGVDSDLGIYMNGGTVLATGNMYDEVEADSEQLFMVLGFNEKKSEDTLLMLKDSEGKAVAAFSAVNDYTMLVYSSDVLTEGDYTMYEVSSVTGDLNGSIYTNITDYKDAVQLQYSSTGMRGMGGGFGGGNMMELPEGMENFKGERPEGFENFKGERPEGFTKPNDGTESDGQMPQMPADGQFPEMPDGQQPGGQTDGTDNAQRPNRGQMMQDTMTEPSTVFSLSKTSYTFSGISEVSTK